MRQTHSLYLIREEKSNDYLLLYQKIIDYLQEGYAVIYTVENNSGKVMEKASLRNIKLENYVKRKKLMIANPQDVYNPLKKLKKLDSKQLEKLWSRHTRKLDISKTKGIVVFSSPDVMIQPDKQSINALVLYEKMLGKTFTSPIEGICCYREISFDELSLPDVLRIITSHECVIHSEWVYQRWQNKLTFDAIKKGIDNVLGEGASNLILRTFKLIYKISDATNMILTRPNDFVVILNKIVGKKISDRILKAILIEIKAIVLDTPSNRLNGNSYVM